ncbi:hypothetical protein L7F22_027134 [Adiantum nelumboides]|nr:hypothetical protein [Adiantum nelumboides]
MKTRQQNIPSEYEESEEAERLDSESSDDSEYAPASEENTSEDQDQTHEDSPSSRGIGTTGTISTSLIPRPSNALSDNPIQDELEAANHLSRLLFVGLVCGISMLILTGAFSSILLKAFVGAKNESLLPAACSYVQIRGLAWPAVLVGLVAQSASLGMQDAWAPLRVLSISSILNFSGDILFCTIFKYGIAGAAWATTISQCVGGYLMLRSLGAKGFNPLAFTVPTLEEFSFMLKLAAPVLLTIFSKVCFFSLVTYMSTALGTVTLAAHQEYRLWLDCLASSPCQQNH